MSFLWEGIEESIVYRNAPFLKKNHTHEILQPNEKRMSGGGIQEKEGAVYK